MNPWFNQEFRKRVKELVESREIALFNGIDSHEEYLKLVNYRKGVLAALDVFKDLMEQMEKLD